MKKVAILLLFVVLLMTACSQTESNISEDQAKSIVVDDHKGNNGEVKIISVSHKNNEYIIKWEIKENCESGTDYVNDDNGKIHNSEGSIC